MYRERITQHYDSLSKSQKRIADFLMTSPRDAAFMTASRLAVVLDVDVATVTRFAQRLDYPGYPELLDEVQARVRDEMSAGVHPAEGASDAGRAFMRAMGNERDNVEHTMSGLSPVALEETLKAIRSARIIYIVGQHTGAYMAYNLAMRLTILGFHAFAVVGDPVAVSLRLLHMGPEDVLIGFGFSGYAGDVTAALLVARERGAKTIGITGSAVSPIARNADIVLLCTAASMLHMPSETAVTAMIESLYAALASERMDKFTAEMKAFGDTYQALNEHLMHPAGDVEESMMKFY